MSGVASAAEGPAPSGGRFFDTYDANQDGKVTKEEFSGDADIFELLDKNKDGNVCLEELGLPADYKPRPLPKESESGEGGMKGGNLARRAEEMKKRFIQLKAMDKDGDGRVSKDEYNGKLPFDFMDKNKDGFIDEKDARGGGEMPGGAMPVSPEEMANRFKEADKNGDGKVSKEEFPGPPERFARLDKDADGFVTIQEFEAAMKDMPQGENGKGGRRMLMQFDKNGDGKIARDEFPGGDEKFKELDKNGDGFVAEDELPRPGGKDGKKGKKPGEGDAPTTPTNPTTPGMPAPSDGSMPGPAPTSGMGALFTALDKDRDGRLSRAEFPGTDDEWRRLDRDQNGWITPEEASSK
jgi:Ca2+-binding EF-hand superfamily protein